MVNKTSMGIAIGIIVLVVFGLLVFLLPKTQQSFVEIGRINYAITQFDSETNQDATYTLIFTSDDPVQKFNAKAGNFELIIGGGHQGELYLPSNLQFDTLFETENIVLEGILGVTDQGEEVNVLIRNAKAKCLIVKAHVVPAGTVPNQLICDINADLIGFDKTTNEEVPSKFYGLNKGSVTATILKEGVICEEEATKCLEFDLNECQNNQWVDLGNVPGTCCDEKIDAEILDDDCEIECTIDSQCGSDGDVGDQYCKDDDVYQKSRTYGCSSNKCDFNEQETLVEECKTGCDEAKCIDANYLTQIAIAVMAIVIIIAIIFIWRRKRK